MEFKKRGGAGSGNFGHEGRPGEIGGSGEGGGGSKDKEKSFDKLFNEGGEGFNPYTPKDEFVKQTTAEQRDSINRQLNGLDYNDKTNSERIKTLREKYDKTYIDEGWTKEATISRREDWNNAIKSGKYTVNGKISSNAKEQLEKDLGFSFNSLKEGVRIWDLKK